MTKPMFLLTSVCTFSLIACGDKSPETVAPAVAPVAVTDCAVTTIVGEIITAPGEMAAAIDIADGKVFAVHTSVPDFDASSPCVTVLPKGAMAMPGLTDAHGHLLGIGLRELTLNLEGTASIADLQARISKQAVGLATDETLFGRGWIETGWPEGRMPAKDDLDAVVSDRPVLLRRSDGHATVVNSMALARAGIDASTPDPDGGRIERDAAGEATGLLVDNAQGLVMALLPKLTLERRETALRKGAQIYAAKGWTGIHNMSVDLEDGDILRRMQAEGKLPLRVFNYYVPEALDAMISRGVSCTEQSIVCDMGLKYYVDGSLGSRGALLFEPYADAPELSGLQLISAENAAADFTKARDAGLQIATHAIGDQGNSLVLDWYKDVLSGTPDHRWRIEHAQIVRLEDIARFQSGGVIASMQPSHAIGDLFFALDRLGEERLAGAYAWRSMLDAGVHLAGGTDAPVEQGDPRIELYAAFQRLALDGYSADHWHPEQALSKDQALAMFTTGPAFAAHMEDQLGQLAPGYQADLTIFSVDPFEYSWDEGSVIATYVAGVRRNAPE